MNAGPHPTALITGVAGQDGSYLAELLLGRGWAVHGVSKPGVDGDPIDALVVRHEVDLSETGTVQGLVREIEPDYVFHLAGISSVWRSWNDPVLTTKVNGVSAAALLDACFTHQEASGKRIVMINASSAEIFAGSGVSLQSETTRIAPTSPYGASKALSHHMVDVYRSRGLEATNAILYNHESPRRPDSFVTRKISKAAVAISRGRQSTLELGNLTAVRDWGWAPDYVQAMAAMAEYGKGDNFVVATGQAHSVADFVAAAFEAVGIDDWREYVRSDSEMLRPTDSARMVGDASKARNVLGWEPTKTFDQVVRAMIEFDMTEEIAA
ncbi:GDP-mannose 4,6 dehydratase [Rhodococcus sp. 05-340-1]|uniref:GDP-mannose 4,6-dehydratase n=1 Tax=unclassified Rhodococcus (in: high G+C Gram-positive bacteria) TaxID=192944 RepID=UPI000B9C3144|nr:MULTISPECIES: GDP-mannose 4,6-dehydratase [unclassified Rhodococcus (in: high G+C Gram-positive bacteria)]OZD62190.1 GDP-mannose 4,6 dehydratase [Rhodococcus sp. 05-340-2]OZD78350.1 GDP-mannose 4,6 dehydratase [Rhodococcus sp. 05-340-1]